MEVQGYIDYFPRNLLLNFPESSDTPFLTPLFNPHYYWSWMTAEMPVAALLHAKAPAFDRDSWGLVWSRVVRDS